MNTFKRHLPTAARLFLGLVFLVMGINGFLHFLPMPPPPPRAAAFFGGMFGTGYMLPLLFGTQVAVALLLLTRRFVPLALTIIAPVIVNIVAFHLFMAPAGLVLALAVLAAELALVWAYRDAFVPLLQANVRPGIAIGGTATILARPAHSAA